MPGLNLTYEYFCEVVGQLTRHSSSPVTPENLNPLIQRVLTQFAGSTIYGVGGHSVLISIANNIGVKISYTPGGEHLLHEQSVFQLIASEPCKHIAHSLFTGPDVIFMELFPNGTLYDRLWKADKPYPVLQWMQQLCDAAACLESVGYAHGDINPRNILFDDQDQIRLIDYDYALKVGETVEVGFEPYVRHRKEDYGIAGPDTEQFALGSVFWFMSRGTELYADIDGAERVNRLIGCKFPELNVESDPIDAIIYDCWHGKFESIAALARRVQQTVLDESLKGKRKMCEESYSRISACLESAS
ncbi:TPA_exp: putative Rho-associated protein kinase [Trichophyton benhamiae CBS 112371]|uniref:Rho-associated protein kinase, putative n=1 Tax=Arthroderma benhamiae (strain ATCC MYA-4681 / CBS 112371) TaxID=663331 RepID=D4B5H8_ARTBC|nr:Rho-associated protein kinase, putative [Trichophyton benhamiae CBS 112371]EFE29422.1 Rho-associated protein kinase, putative [Trichophyton benhamiae CBS 112371]DAA72703.1 TPA_exp: putative Rho-associated protein kinase [Trichophyton benhamiae CBS 112371]